MNMMVNVLVCQRRTNVPHLYSRTIAVAKLYNKIFHLPIIWFHVISDTILITVHIAVNTVVIYLYILCMF